MFDQKLCTTCLFKFLGTVGNAQTMPCCYKGAWHKTVLKMGHAKHILSHYMLALLMHAPLRRLIISKTCNKLTLRAVIFTNST